MANDDIDTNDKNEMEETIDIKTDKNKLDARRRLEEYMEMKKLRELTEF